jgi:hypothetical protein
LIYAGLGCVEYNEGKAVSAHPGQHVNLVGKLISQDSRGKV